ncbi:nucleophile aminohydrolase [Chytridium lagenaria]|nr:nucleophile aminohydrolase [Chytridium lagenaria]
MSGYDRALTVFSPDGHLFQVEYHCMKVGVRGADVVVLGVEKKSALKLQDPRTVRKIAVLDDHVCLAFAVEVLVNKARIECQSHRLTVEDPVSVEHITRYIAGVQQKYTQSGGVRPFGISTLIIGFDSDKVPKLYQTDPSGIYSAWKKSYKENLSKDEAIRLAIKSLLNVVQTGAKNIEIAYMGSDCILRTLQAEEVDAIVASVEAEQQAEGNTTGGSSSSS